MSVCLITQVLHLICISVYAGWLCLHATLTSVSFAVCVSSAGTWRSARRVWVVCRASWRRMRSRWLSSQNNWRNWRKRPGRSWRPVRRLRLALFIHFMFKTHCFLQIYRKMPTYVIPIYTKVSCSKTFLTAFYHKLGLFAMYIARTNHVPCYLKRKVSNNKSLKGMKNMINCWNTVLK